MKTETTLFVLLLIVLIPIEIGCALLAYETIGELAQLEYSLGIVFLNLLCIALAFRSRLAAAVGAILVALLIIPYQAVLGNRLLNVQAEATQIVAFAYEQKAESGAFPPDLSGYTFHNPKMAAYIQSYTLANAESEDVNVVDGEHFRVSFRVGTVNTSHWYSSETGWGYYPD